LLADGGVRYEGGQGGGKPRGLGRSTLGIGVKKEKKSVHVRHYGCTNKNVKINRNGSTEGKERTEILGIKGSKGKSKSRRFHPSIACTTNVGQRGKEGGRGEGHDRSLAHQRIS